MKTEPTDVKSPARLARPALAALALSLIAAPAAAKQGDAPAKPRAGNWGSHITETDGGHLLGNPEAEGRLVEFMSYTCSHCADFARSGEGAIKLLYVPSGKISFEVRHLIRDPVDLTAALAAQCGPADKFFGNHAALIGKHPDWMAKARSMTQAQMARWNFGTFSARAQAIASDLDFYEIMQSRGYSRVELDKCLTDETKARAIAAKSQQDIETFGLRGTPTFFMSGKEVDAHDWKGLQPHLDALFSQ